MKIKMIQAQHYAYEDVHGNQGRSTRVAAAHEQRMSACNPGPTCTLVLVPWRPPPPAALPVRHKHTHRHRHRHRHRHLHSHSHSHLRTHRHRHRHCHQHRHRHGRGRSLSRRRQAKSRPHSVLVPRWLTSQGRYNAKSRRGTR